MKLYILCGVMLFMGCSCETLVFESGNGNIESEKRQLEDFREIRLAGNYEVSLKQGAQKQIVIVTDENLLEYIQTEVNNGVLEIEDVKKLKSKNGIKLFITYQELDAITSAGASVIKSEDRITADHLRLELPGAGLVDIEVDVKDLEIDLTGAGLIKLKGTAHNQDISLKGVGSLEAYQLESRICRISVSGLGGAQLNVKENLSAEVKGIGGIKYKGDPQIVNDHISGIGTIRKADEEEEEEASSIEI